jgi:hypothetical protein
MKKYLIVLFALLPLLSIAQKPGEKLEALKIGFLTERLNLTPEEAKVFWPVYNQFQDELEKVRRQRKEALRNAREDFATMSESDLEKLVDNEIIFRQQELDIIKKFHPQFKQVLPVRKVAMLYKAEEDFKRKVIEWLKEKGGRPEGRR